MEDAASAGAPKNTPDSTATGASTDASDSASAGASAPRISRSGSPLPRGRPGLTWDGRGNLGRSAPQATARAAPVPHAPTSPEAQPSEAVSPASVSPASAPRAAATATGGDLALDLRRGGAVASFGRRAIGFIADQLTLGLLLLLLIVAGLDSGGVLAFSLVVPMGYHWLFDSLGWSPGKRVAGLRVVNARGEPPGPIAGGARALVALLIPFNLSYVWAAWDPRVQTLHDKAARTYVVPLSELERLSRR